MIYNGFMDYEKKFGRKPVAVELFQQNNYPENPFRQVKYELLYIEKGNGQFFFGNSSFEVKEGDFLFINSFEDHYFKNESKSEKFICSRLLFEISALGNSEDECRAFFLSARFSRFLKISDDLIMRFCEAARAPADFSGRELIFRSLLFDVLACAVNTNQYVIVSEISSSGKRSLSAIDNAVVYIKENYAEYLNLSALLQLTNYSKSQFIRLFKENTGMNVSEYINKYRIEKACLDLIYTNKNITEIATTNGFNNIQYFSRKFKEYMSCTPKQYQKKGIRLTERV